MAGGSSQKVIVHIYTISILSGTSHITEQSFRNNNLCTVSLCLRQTHLLSQPACADSGMSVATPLTSTRILMGLSMTESFCQFLP